MADPTFNREKAEAVIASWFGAYGANQIGTPASGDWLEGGEADSNAFIQELINKSDPERVFWGDDSNSLISEIERLLNRGASTSDVTTILGNISASINDWNSLITGARTGKTVADKLADAFTAEAVAEQSTAMGLELREEGFSDKQMLKKYEQFVGRILPKTTAGLTLSGFDPTTRTQVRNAINTASAGGLNGIEQAKLRIAEAFATGLNDLGEEIDFTNEDTILKSLSNVQVNWDGKSTTTNPDARDLAITSLMLAKGPSSPSAYQSWIANTFKDTASTQSYLANPSQYQGTASSSGAGSDWENVKNQFSGFVNQNVEQAGYRYQGMQQGSDGQIGIFTAPNGETRLYTTRVSVPSPAGSNRDPDVFESESVTEKDWRQEIAERNATVAETRAHNDANQQKISGEVAKQNAQTAADRAAADKTYQEGQLDVAEGRLQLDKDDSEWTQTFSETKHQAEMEYKNKVAGHERWYQINKIAGESADRELRGRIADEQNQLAIILQNASASLQTGISNAQIASREKIAQMAYDEVTADTAARLEQAGLELEFQTAKWEDQIGLARDEFDFNKQKFGIEIAEKMRQFDTLSAADQATFDQRYQFWNNLSAAEKATLEQNNFQFDNLSAAEEQSFKQDMFKFQNVSASDQASLDLQQQMFEGVSGNTQATLDQDMFKFANISALDTAQLAQDESQFSRNLAQDESQFSRNLGESGRQFNIGEAGDTLRTQIGTQPALMGAITDRDRLMNEMLSQGGNYLARAFNQYGQAAPTDQPSVADRVNALRAQTVEQNALAQMGADAANEAIKQAEYQKYMQTAAQSAQARWDEYVAANTSTTGGGTYQFANPNFNADEIAAQRANLTAAAQEAQARADYFSGTDYTDPITGQVYEADIFPQGVPDIGFQAKAAQPHLDAATAAQAALDKYQAPSQFLTGENPAESVYTGMNRNQWNQQYGQANNMQDWWNTVADQPAMQQRFTQPDLAPVQPMTSMEELVALSRGFLSPAAQDVYFGDAARPRTGFGFALPSYQQLQRLAPEERDALNTAMLTEFNVPLANAVFEERLRGQPTRTTAPAASARPTQMFRRTPYGTTNTGLRQSTAPMAQVREASRQPMFRSS